MSFQYEFLKRLVKLVGIKKRWTGDMEALLAQRRRQNARTSIPSLRDEAMDIDQIAVEGFPVVRMRHKSGSAGVCLFIIGGGMVSAPRPDAVKKALRFAKETGLDLFVPYYPLCTDYPLTAAYDMIYATYALLLKSYAPERITLLGTSSGGNLALGLAPYIHLNHPATPMPGHIIALSPGTCVKTEEEWQRMLALDEKDVAIPARFMKDAEAIMRHGSESVPEYMIFLQTADFTGCPPVTFIYGSDETLYAVAPSFEAAMQRCGVKYRMIVGQGMFHCYPVFPLVPEAKAGWQMLVELAKRGPQP